MGVDAKIYLPGNVRLTTVCDVVARLLDAPVVKTDLDSSSHPGAWYARSRDGVVKYRNYEGMPGMAGVTIEFGDPKLIGFPTYGFSYHFEFGGYKNRGASRGIIQRARALNLAVFVGLADFFGGVVDFADCDDKDNDYEVESKSDSLNCPEDGKPWQALHERIMAVKPLTLERIAHYERHASYHESAEDVEARLKLKRRKYAAPKRKVR